MSQRENAKSARKERASDKERLKAEKRLAKARIRSERAARAKAKRERSGSSSFIKQLMGSASKSDRSKKTHEEKLKRQKKARAQAGETASYIGYDAIYKDGIAQVEEGLFSQTIEFSDISYQSARREKGMLTFFQPRTSYAASPSDFLYCTGLIPPNDSFIRSSLYQRI